MQERITPWEPSLVQPASLDVRLGKLVLVPNVNDGSQLLVGVDKPTYDTYQTPYVLDPQAFALFTTKAEFDFPDNIAGKYEGKSGLGRIGLMTHITAGFIDPGFKGNLTLELYNVGPYCLYLQEGIKIGQIAFFEVEPVMRPYGSESLKSHYQDSVGAVGYRP